MNKIFHNKMNFHSKANEKNKIPEGKKTVESLNFEILKIYDMLTNLIIIKQMHQKKIKNMCVESLTSLNLHILMFFF
jgi:hypothetical protein